MKNIMIVDDEESICKALRFALEDKYKIYIATNIIEFDNLITKVYFDIVLLDLKFGDINGIELLNMIKVMYPSTIVIIMTAYGTIETSIEAIKNGAYDYILKPIDLNVIRKLICDAEKYQNLNKEILIKNNIDNIENNIIGKSSHLLKVVELIDRVKDIDVNVLIQGESGTGKELIAKRIHYSGNRSNKPFIAINCGAIPNNLIESELFGFCKGAFTGADKSKMGAFENADTGTMFLDEIGEMDLSCQVKLLRVIQEREIMPLGANKSKSINVRIIAATNKKLEDEVKNGTFRSDLFYRLNVLPIYIPSLNERKEDIPLLIDYFINKANKLYNLNIEGITTGAMYKLTDRLYEGNIRELENIIYRSCVLAVEKIIDENVIDNNDLNAKYKNYMNSSISIKIGSRIEEMEKNLILKTLDFVNGNKVKASKILGISLRSLQYKVKNYLEERNE